jgi:hypothetical protein
VMERWSHTLVTRLQECMDVIPKQIDVNGNRGMEYDITLYGNSFTLQVVYKDNFYNLAFEELLLNFKTKGQPIPGPGLDVGNVVRQIRNYAKEVCERMSVFEHTMNEWHIELADALVDAGFRWCGSKSFEFNQNYLKVLLGKNGNGVYLIVELSMNSRYQYTLTDTVGRIIGEWDANGVFNPVLVVAAVSDAYSTEFAASSFGSNESQQKPQATNTTHMPQATDTTHMPQATDTAHMPRATKTNKLQLYDMVIGLLIWIHEHEQDPRVDGVMKLLNEAKALINRGN